MFSRPNQLLSSKVYRQRIDSTALLIISKFWKFLKDGWDILLEVSKCCLPNVLGNGRKKNPKTWRLNNVNEKQGLIWVVIHDVKQRKLQMNWWGSWKCYSDVLSKCLRHSMFMAERRTQNLELELCSWMTMGLIWVIHNQQCFESQEWEAPL